MPSVPSCYRSLIGLSSEVRLIFIRFESLLLYFNTRFTNSYMKVL
jgi:hypothetical protein